MSVTVTRSVLQAVTVANHRQLTDMKDVKEFEALLSWFEPQCELTMCVP